MATKEEVPFLSQSAGSRRSRSSSNDGSHTGHDRDARPSDAVRALRRTRNVSLVANAVLLVVCALLATTLLFSNMNHQVPSDADRTESLPEPYSPANSAIEYEYKHVVVNDTRLVGPPTDEWETAMHELLDGTLLRISEEELGRMGDQSIALRDGGYAGGLGIAHNLHCVKKIKQFLYREHFYPGIEGGPFFTKTQLHADHCLDFIRQSLMCHADFTMYTLQWTDNGSEKPEHRAPGLQKCVNWNLLQAWMQSRSTNSDMFLGQPHGG